MPAFDRVNLRWSPAGVQTGGGTKIMIQGGLRISPDAEEAQFAAYLLAPLAVVMCSQRK
jgi:hypothetical protein